MRFYYSLVPNFLCICLLALRPPFRYSKNYPFICELVSPQMQSAEVVLGPLDSPAFLHLIFLFPALTFSTAASRQKSFRHYQQLLFLLSGPFHQTNPKALTIQSKSSVLTYWKHPFCSFQKSTSPFSVKKNLPHSDIFFLVKNVFQFCYGSSFLLPVLAGTLWRFLLSLIFVFIIAARPLFVNRFF